MQFAWWSPEVDDFDRHSILNSNFDTVKRSQHTRWMNAVNYDSLYDGMDYRNMAGTQAMFDRRPRMPPISFNAVRVVGDTLLSKLVQAETKVTFLTDGGDWAERKKAELLDRFVFGEFYRLSIYELSTTSRHDSIRQGNGYIFFSHENGQVTAERVHPLEVYVDMNETFAGPPRQLFREKFLTKEVALALWGTDDEKREMINSAKIVGDTQYHYFTAHVGEMIRVVEAWHLPSGPDANDGLHMIVLDSGTLFKEEWKRDCFPCAVFRLYPRSRGFYAQGLVERQLELQLTLNKLIRRKHACIHLLSAPYFLIEAGSRVVKQHFNTDIGNFIEYLGVKPELVINKAVSTDLDAAIPQILSWMFQDAGINELEAAGVKPEGLDSAPAIERFSDTSGIRHTPVLKENERFFMQCAERILEEVRDVARKNGGKYETFGHFKDHAEVLNWADLDLEKEAYVMKMANMNTLPQTPSGRVNEVIRLSNAGVLTPVQAVRALESPDITAITGDITAPEEDIEWTIYQMTKPKGARYMPPEPFQDLEEGLIKIGHAYLKERDAGAPEPILRNLRRWMADADRAIKNQQDAQMAAQAQMAPPAGVPGAPGAPGAAPMPQPLGQASANPLSASPQQ